MKKLFAAALLALSSFAFGATLIPVQALNPAGSTSGQVVASSGPSANPAWTTITLSGLSGTVAIANGGTGATSQSAALTNLLGSSVVPALNGGTGVTTPAAELTRIGAAATSGTLAQFAATTSAQLAGVISDETGTGAAVFSNSPTINTPTINGVTNGSSAATGSVGEHPSNQASGISLSTSANTNVATLSLSPGDWDVWATVSVAGAGGASITTAAGGVSATSLTLGSFGTYWQMVTSGFGANGSVTFGTPRTTMQLSATTTVYCIANATFPSGTASAGCKIEARRPR